MDSMLRFFKSVWEFTGGSFLAQKRHKRRNAEYNAYWGHQCQPFTPLSSFRPRSPNIREGDHSTKSNNASQSKSRLLALPLEIRLLIWECAVGGNLIALYRDGGRLTHSLVDGTNSPEPGRDIPIRTESILDEATLMFGSTHAHGTNLPPAHTLRVLAMLQTCWTIYTEAITLLYSHNTFLFLQNHTLRDFQRAILPHRFASIRSMHIHWQFQEYRQSGRLAQWPWDQAAFVDTLLLVSRQTKNLTSFSMFIQDPLQNSYTYGLILRCVERVYASMASPRKLFVLRLPCLTSDPAVEFLNIPIVEELINDANKNFTIVRPSDGSSGVMSDRSTGAACGWRQSVAFLPPDDVSSDFVVRSYTV